MGTAATPPLPPDIVRQQAAPEEAKSVFAQQGLNQPQQGMQVVEQIMAKFQELDKWAGEIKTMLDAFDPSLTTLLQPIAQSAAEIMKALQAKTQRSGMARGAPVTPTPPQPNPAAGPPNPNAA